MSVGGENNFMIIYRAASSNWAWKVHEVHGVLKLCDLLEAKSFLSEHGRSNVRVLKDSGLAVAGIVLQELVDGEWRSR